MICSKISSVCVIKFSTKVSHEILQNHIKNFVLYPNIKNAQQMKRHNIQNRDVPEIAFSISYCLKTARNAQLDENFIKIIVHVIQNFLRWLEEFHVTLPLMQINIWKLYSSGHNVNVAWNKPWEKLCHDETRISAEMLKFVHCVLIRNSASSLTLLWYSLKLLNCECVRLALLQLAQSKTVTVNCIFDHVFSKRA